MRSQPTFRRPRAVSVWLRPWRLKEHKNCRTPVRVASTKASRPLRRFFAELTHPLIPLGHAASGPADTAERPGSQAAVLFPTQVRGRGPTAARARGRLQVLPPRHPHAARREPDGRARRVRVRHRAERRGQEHAAAARLPAAHGRRRAHPVQRPRHLAPDRSLDPVPAPQPRASCSRTSRSCRTGRCSRTSPSRSRSWARRRALVRSRVAEALERVGLAGPRRRARRAPLGRRATARRDRRARS